jgi:hypothetical protein
MKKSLPFQPALFAKVFAVIFTLVAIAFVVVVRIHGSIATRDIIGSLISALIGSYLVHLWLMPADSD